MANKKRGEVVVNIGGMDKVLKFTNNNICEIETYFGDKPIHAIVQIIGVKVARALLYFGIQWEGKRPSIEQVGDMMGNLKKLEYFTGKIGEALNLYAGEDEPVEESEGN